MDQCIKCGHTIKDEFFEGVSGNLCKECLKDMQVYHALRSMNLVKEVKLDLVFRDLEELATHIGYSHPEEIHIVAACEGFYDTDEQGDPHLSKDGINDFLHRFGADIRVDSLVGGIHCISV